MRKQLAYDLVPVRFGTINGQIAHGSIIMTRYPHRYARLRVDSTVKAQWREHALASL
jgi:hypothetical protein